MSLCEGSRLDVSGIAEAPCRFYGAWLNFGYGVAINMVLLLELGMPGFARAAHRPREHH
jgi:hypothetical protein